MHTTTEVAKILGVSSDYIRLLVFKGKAIPLRKFGATHVFSNEEIERLRQRDTKRGPKKLIK